MAEYVEDTHEEVPDGYVELGLYGFSGKDQRAAVLLSSIVKVRHAGRHAMVTLSTGEEFETHESQDRVFHLMNCCRQWMTTTAKRDAEEIDSYDHPADLPIEGLGASDVRLPKATGELLAVSPLEYETSPENRGNMLEPEIAR